MDKQCMQPNPKHLTIFAYCGGERGREEEIKLSLPQKAQLMLSVLEFPKAEKKAQGAERVAAWQPKALTEARFVAKHGHGAGLVAQGDTSPAPGLGNACARKQSSHLSSDTSGADVYV